MRGGGDWMVDEKDGRVLERREIVGVDGYEVKGNVEKESVGKESEWYDCDDGGSEEISVL